MIQQCTEKCEETVTELFVEKSSGIIHEVQAYDSFILLRPVTPGFESILKKLDKERFLELFEEFPGTKEDLLPFFQGEGTGLFVKRV